MREPIYPPDEPDDAEVPEEIHDLRNRLLGPTLWQLCEGDLPEPFRWAAIPDHVVAHIRGYVLGQERAADPSQRLAVSIELGRDAYFLRFRTTADDVVQYAVCPGVLVEDPAAPGGIGAGVRWAVDVDRSTGGILDRAFESPEFW